MNVVTTKTENLKAAIHQSEAAVPQMRFYRKRRVGGRMKNEDACVLWLKHLLLFLLISIFMVSCSGNEAEASEVYYTGDYVDAEYSASVPVSTPTPCSGSRMPSINVGNKIYVREWEMIWFQNTRVWIQDANIWLDDVGTWPYGPGIGHIRYLIDDSFVSIGYVTGHLQRITDAEETLQTNSAFYVGAEIFVLDDILIAKINGELSLFSFRGETTLANID